jgi:hypothetical protein
MPTFQTIALICLLIAFSIICITFIQVINFKFDDEIDLEKENSTKKSL